MRPFTKNELLIVVIIFAVVVGFTLKGLKDATRRARDFQRKQDLGIISDALHKYHDDFGFFPPSENGKVKACKNDNFEEVYTKLKTLQEFDRNLFFEGLKTCDWGSDPLRDVQDDNYSPYLSSIPSDPKKNSGITYLYLSNTVRFQLYTYLEGESDENGFDQGIVLRSLQCGTGVCSYGKSYGVTPLNMSIDDYENILLKESQTGKE